MKITKNKKLWIAISIICAALGSVLLIAGRSMGGCPGFYIDRRGLHIADETVVVESSQGTKDLEPFEHIELAAEYTDIELAISDKFAVEYRVTGTYGEPVCEVQNGRFIFQEAEPLNVFNFGLFSAGFGIAVNEPSYYVRIEIPQNTQLTDVSLDIESGNVDIPSLQAKTLEIKNEYGDIRLGNYEGEKLKIQMESGNLSADALDAFQADIQNDYGDISIRGADGKQLAAKLSSCNCQIERMDFSTVTMENEYGDIRLGLPGNLGAYGFDLTAEYGDIRIENKKQEIYDGDDNVIYRTAGDGKKKVAVSCESGNIEITASP